MAGYGTRLRPHTWSRPKQLISLANQTVLEHVLDTFDSLPDPDNVEYIFIVGYLGEKIEAFMKENYPNLKVRYVVQSEMRGQSHAIYLAKEYLGGPMLMVFADTLLETDLSFLENETSGAVAWVKAVPDPRRFGVVSLDSGGWVQRLIEKPGTLENNLAVVGFYYFRESADLIAAIEEQMQRGIQLKGEFFLADAVNIMLERGLRMRIEQVNTWLDAGTVDDVLSTNRYLLEHGHNNSNDVVKRPGVMVIPPVYVHPNTRLTNCIIGPNATIGPSCIVESSIVRNSILECEAHVTDVILENSLIGRETRIQGRAGVLNIGDHTALTL
jgi:glucose-1-phosphate thymidylyltransferase